MAVNAFSPIGYIFVVVEISLESNSFVVDTGALYRVLCVPRLHGCRDDSRWYMGRRCRDGKRTLMESGLNAMELLTLKTSFHQSPSLRLNSMSPP